MTEHLKNEGEFLKLKCRQDAGGEQKDRALYKDVSLPNSSSNVTFIVLIIAVAEDRPVVTIDVAGAYVISGGLHLLCTNACKYAL